MKTKSMTTRWLGVALACGIIAFAASVEAKKPPKPPPEPPPAPGPAYWIIAVEGEINPWSISDSGVLVGSAWYQLPGEGFQSPAALPPRIIDGEPQYPAADVRWLPDEDGMAKYGYCIAMNEAGLAVGYVDDLGPVRAILWLADGTGVDLGVFPAELSSTANDINDAGLVLVGIGHENEAGEMSAVVVPLDLNPDGEPDTWVVDYDADGINDLLFPIDVEHNLLPLVMNPGGWSDLRAGGINRNGWIHGKGELDGVWRGFVAIPVEP